MVRRWWGRRGRRARVLIIGVGSVMVLAMAIGTYAVALLLRVSRIDVELHESADGGTNVLIVGVDSRAGLSEAQQVDFGSTRGARADIVLLLRIPDDGGAPVLLMVPRDLLVLGRDGGLHRLALEWLKGPQALVDTLCHSLGLGADHLLRVEMEGFIDLVSAAGGVELDFARPLRDTAIPFEVEAGRQHLDGEQALQYVRARHLQELGPDGWVPVPNQRSEQADIVLRSVAQQADLGAGPAGVNRVLWSLGDVLAVDERTSVRDLVNVYRGVREVAAEATVELPTREVDGPIPFAELSPFAHPVLGSVGAGGPECSTAALPGAAR